jgi:uncharacterized protein YdaU (DUF1376 family)
MGFFVWKKPMNFYPFHIGDYAAHTRNLSLMEDLAYRRLLDAYYLAERPLDGCAADVARSIGMRDHLEAVEYVLGKFFLQSEKGWVNTRADQEIERFKVKSEQASRAGKASAERRSNARSTPVEKTATDVQPPITQDPLPITQEPEKQTPVAIAPAAKAAKFEYDPLFLLAWDAYPRRDGSSKRDAFKAWSARIKAGVSPTTIAEGLDRYAAYCKANRTEPRYIKTAETFFGPGEHYLGEWPIKPTVLQRVYHDISGMDYTQGVDADGNF